MENGDKRAKGYVAAIFSLLGRSEKAAAMAIGGVVDTCLQFFGAVFLFFLMIRRTNRVDRRDREPVRALVHIVPGVAFDPAPVDFVPRNRFIEPLP